jgi:hypothetical protein
LHDLIQLNFSCKYFSGILINDVNKDINKLKKYIGLTDEQEFYKTYGEFIGSREFRFRNKNYEYDAEKKEVVFVRHQDADKYLRIGSNWIKIIKKPNKFGKLEEEMKPWSIGEIERDYKIPKPLLASSPGMTTSATNPTGMVSTSAYTLATTTYAAHLHGTVKRAA